MRTGWGRFTYQGIVSASAVISASPVQAGCRGQREYRLTREVRDWENSGQFPSAKLGRGGGL